MPFNDLPFGVRQREVFEGLGAEARALVSLQREVAHPEHRDEWGNWDGQFATDQASLESPVVDQRHRKGAFKWKDRHPFALAISHDIDLIDPFSSVEYWARARRHKLGLVRHARLAAGFLKHALKARLAPARSPENSYWDFTTWLECERKFGFRSTWFVFPDKPGPRSEYDCVYGWAQTARWSASESMPFVEAIRKVSELGWEIGLHSSSYSATDPELLLKQKFDSEKALGKEIVSIRQHYLRYDPLKTPGVHEKAGFLVDSTLGMNRRIGFRAGTSFPFFVHDHAGSRLTNVLEVPLVLQDVALFGGHSLKLGFEDAKKNALRLLDEVERVNGVYSILFHPDCQTEAPKWDLFNVLLEECRRRGAWGPTLSELRSSWLS